MPAQIAVVDSAGLILYVNKSWCDFGIENGGSTRRDWVGGNYLSACGIDGPQEPDSADGIKRSIERVLSGEISEFQCDYPCDAPDKKRWFMMRIVPMADDGDRSFVITHTDITERWNAEDEVKRLARIDPLTGIANRRSLDEFLADELKRSIRAATPISLAVFDIDHFKSFNDTFGHPAGDKCIQSVAKIIEQSARRPSDMAARIGGEEFVLVLGGAASDKAVEISEQIRIEISQVHVVRKLARPVTVSAGLITTVPDQDTNRMQLMSMADQALYVAKRNGRDNIESTSLIKNLQRDDCSILKTGVA